jgi:hemolysin III
VGIVLKLTAFERVTVVSFVLYPAMGWAAIIVGPVLLDHVSVAQLVLIVAGGVAYTLGFPVLIARRPDPWPRTFGYHEVWHLFTVIAATLHFVAVTSVLA